MGKTYIDTVKYRIYAEVDIKGLVDKPDVVGAIFGQTEGLLGDELDLRELQKNGRIGRIEVELFTKNGKTYGSLKIPSSLDMVETSIIAAALESVDRIGPCEGKIKVIKIEDTRNEKRKMVLERAKELLKELMSKEIPESREISELVRKEVKVAKVGTYGKENLTAGPDIDTSDSLIYVEGRADVINLLKNDINNVIAIGGARIPQTLIELSKGKEITVFLDGDRGGDIILKELLQAGAEIDFVARAPRGKEVEELTRKEIIKYLRNKVPFSQYEDHFIKRRSRKIKEIKPVRITINEENKEDRNEEKKERIEENKKRKEEKKKIKKTKEEIIKELETLNNTLKARIYSKDYELIKEIPVRDIIKVLNEVEGVGIVVFDGIITQRLVDIAKEKGINTIIGVRKGNVRKVYKDVEIITKQ